MPDPEKKLNDIILDPFASTHAPQQPNPQKQLAQPDGNAAGGFETATRAYEAKLLQNALEACRFNQAEAARQLGLSYYQFRHHLRVHGMLSDAKKAASAA
jgi:psp operon transcriptional activator